MIFIASMISDFRLRPTFINNAAIVVSRGRILAFGKPTSIIKKYSAHPIYLLNNTVLMPGLVNIHAHLELPPILDDIRTKTFPDWVLNLIAAKRKLGNTEYTTACKKNIDALITSGTTTVGEICTHNISPSLLKESGMRASIFHEIIGMESSSEFKVQSSKEKPFSNLLRYALSPHSPYTVSESILRSLRNKRLAMHVAESKDEIRLLQGKKSGLEKLYEFAKWDKGWTPKANSSFEYLERIGLLTPRLMAVHAVQANDSDIKLIKKSKTSIAHCPRSNKELGVGKMPLKKMLDAGITIGLGSDSLASVQTLNMWDEMRYAYKIHKKDGVTAEDILRLATIGGAKALGFDKGIGTLEVGKKADFIAVPLPKRDTGDLYSDLLRETNSCIMSVVDGKIIFSRN